MPLYRRGRVWWVRFTAPDGGRVRESSGTQDRRQAQEYHDKRRAALWRSSKLKEPQHSWDEAALRYLSESSSLASIETIRGHLRAIHPHLTTQPLRAVSRDKVDAMTKGWPATSANRRVEIVRAILRRAQEWGWLQSIPRLRLAKRPTHRITPLTPEQAATLLEQLPAHLAAMVRFTLATGLRERNVTEIEWSQVDLKRHVAWVHPDQAKARKAIRVPLNADAMKVLRRQVGEHPERVFAFKGRPVTRANNHAWRKACARAGLQIRWHDLRHTWASWHVQRGTPLNALQMLGGWQSLAMVTRYAHFQAEDLAGFAGRIAGTVLAQRPTKEARQRRKRR